MLNTRNSSLIMLLYLQSKTERFKFNCKNRMKTIGQKWRLVPTPKKQNILPQPFDEF